MQKQATSWHPSHDEVEHILEELRPLIRRMARRDEFMMAQVRWERGHVGV